MKKREMVVNEDDEGYRHGDGRGIT